MSEKESLGGVRSAAREIMASTELLRRHGEVISDAHREMLLEGIHQRASTICRQSEELDADHHPAGVLAGAEVPTPTHHHAVVFYSSDDHLIGELLNFVEEGVDVGEGVLVVATPPHSAALQQAMRHRGMSSPRNVVHLDAAETLATFAPGSTPDADSFTDVIVALVAQLRSRYGGVRIFGEMVDVLWSAGAWTSAVRLEEMWEEARETHPFTLLCSYRTDDPAGEGLSEVCELHDVVHRQGVAS